jgi:glycosidase
MPDLNYETPAVKDSMFDTATYWLDTVGVDGFRLDAVLYIIEEGSQLQNTASTLQFWSDYNAHVKAVKPDAVSVGEAWTSTSTVLQYVTQDRLDFCFEFDLSYATINAVNWSDAWSLSDKANQVYQLYPHLQFGTFLTNHDQDRAFTVLGEDEGKAKVAAGIYMTLPGVPFVYYGEEIGMIGSGDHLNIRTPMQWTDGANAGFTTGTPWNYISGNYAQYNVAVEELDTGSLLNWYKRLIHARNRTPALRRGTHDPLASSASSVLAFVRSHEGQAVLCMANTSSSPRNGITLAGSAGSLVPGAYTLINVLDAGDTFDITVSPAYEIEGLSLAGHEVAIYMFAVANGVNTGDDYPARTGLQLRQSYPNPHDPHSSAATINYHLPAPSEVKLSVYDVSGHLVRTLRDGASEEAGPHSAVWRGRDEEGRQLPSGVYFYRLEAGGESCMRRMVLLR